MLLEALLASKEDKAIAHVTALKQGLGIVLTFRTACILVWLFGLGKCGIGAL